MVSQETTRDRWAFDGPLFAQRRGYQDVPKHFLKNARWSEVEGGYITNDKAGRIIKVEFSFDHLCWAETCWSHHDVMNSMVLTSGEVTGLSQDMVSKQDAVAGKHRSRLWMTS